MSHLISKMLSFLVCAFLFSLSAIVFGEEDDPLPTYRVVGNKIVDNRGNQFIPYGVQLDGILTAQPNWRKKAFTYLQKEQVKAARDFWHSNTVSMQISSAALFARAPYDDEYLKHIDQVVQWSKELKMNILLVLQYEGAGNSFQVMPTQDSVRFWKFIARHYALSANVFFDVFNEPRLISLGYPADSNEAWEFWKNGGTAGGQTYAGMQELVDTIRESGFHNLIFVDGLAAGEDIALLSGHMLRGRDVVYAIHPYFGAGKYKGMYNSVEGWDKWFGKAAVSGDFPVVADEWSSYEHDEPNNGANCIIEDPKLITQFFEYLRARDIGVIGYALFPGILIRGWDFTNPTAFDRTPATCTGRIPFPNYSPDAQGVGRMLVDYFRRYSKPL